MSRNNTRGKKATWPCGVCESSVPDGGIKCDACQKWHHVDCIDGVDKDDIAYMKKKLLKLHWYCRVCDNTVTELLSNFEKFKKLNMEVKKMKDDIDKKYSDMVKRMDRLEKEKVNTKSNINQLIEKRVEDIAANVNTQIDLEEEREIEKRKCNLIFYGVPESEETIPVDRMEADYQKVNEILTEKTEVTREDIRDIFRVGKKSDNGTKRPLMLKFHDEERKMEVLRVCKNLSIIDNNEIKTVFVNIDRTPKQREEFNKLRAEVKERTAKGEKGLIIRGNKIVVHEFFHAQRAARTKNIWANHCKNYQNSSNRETS